jgi:S-adenosylmethionine uptake transporter
MNGQNTRLGVAPMIAAVFVLTRQDALSRHLAAACNALMVVMIRYRVFAAFVLALALRRPGGPRAGITTRHAGLHLLCAALLIAGICVIVTSRTLIGLIDTHAVFAACPLIIMALSGPVPGAAVVVGAGLVTLLYGRRPRAKVPA